VQLSLVLAGVAVGVADEGALPLVGVSLVFSR
jgi:hypothetical protein